MTQIRNKLTAQERHIWTLRMVILFLLLLLAYAIHKTSIKLEEITVHVPPDLSQGTTLKGGQIGKSNVFTFANYVMTSVNEWNTSGRDDFPKLIEEYTCVITPGFKARLERSLNQKEAQGELDRSRSVARLGPYTDKYVNFLGNGTWVVWLDLTLKETLLGQDVKDTVIRYPVRVIKDTRLCNPMKLAIDGYEYEPKRI